ncbi:enoyl-CoA hydratase/isomerase family protein [Nocardia zapadnayensis]|uniref:enoyl-CoA hydratase/isomerase family protein n=1 Tax=Nocardia rhamnosiphila TaxID=426716 RepID=UPI0022470355|nr:enoyl-CoA hydratase/isomerase family protein [Nocardia zapadnayensis]MCX0269151.1 enoyl-CoA hydratase/isomerase family protein [Nocardia zapadnayensis]
MTANDAACPSTFTAEERSGVLVVTLDRPPANALNRTLINQLARLFTELTESSDAPAVVLTGQGGKFFTAGGDIKELEGVATHEIDGRMRDFHALLVALDRYPRPVVAAVNGHCVGGGMEIALFADLVFAAEHARFGFPEINHGLLPADKGVRRSAAVLGTRATRTMLLTGELFDARRAEAIGLVDTVVDPTRLIETAVAAAHEASTKAPVLYGALKHSMNSPDDDQDEISLRRTLAAAAAYFDDPRARALREGWNAGRDRATPGTAERLRQQNPVQPAKESR